MDITTPSQSSDRVHISPYSAHCFLRFCTHVGQSLDGSRRFIHQVRSPRIAGLALSPFALELHAVYFRPSETRLFLGFGAYIDRSPRCAFSCNDRLRCKLLRATLKASIQSPNPRRASLGLLWNESALEWHTHTGWSRPIKTILSLGLLPWVHDCIEAV
jgi:hypothetical protein